MNKVSIPHIRLKDKRIIDLYFEYLDTSDRKKIIKDLQEDKDIKLPNFDNINVHNTVNEFDEKDIDKVDENFIMRFINTKHEPKHPILTYDENKHEYKLNKRYDLEKMIQEVVKNKQHETINAKK